MLNGVKSKMGYLHGKKKGSNFAFAFGERDSRERQKENNERITIDKEIQYKSHFINEP